MIQFDVEIFNPDPPRMVPDTAHIASALQNTTLHPLDLLVRESIQNSLDAAIDENPDQDVRVEFKRGEFDSSAFADALGAECGSRLKTWLAKQKANNQYIAVRDSRCMGLTGDPKDNTSNVYKLIYGFLDGKDAENATAGGSFGVGKTVYLHFGIGFVCYYSRIQSEQRLSVFYCNNNSRKNIFEKAFMPFQLAWWGTQGTLTSRAVYPTTDEEFIEKFLGMFNIKPYRNGETGTTVIVPFFDEKVAHSEKTKFAPWLASVDDYLRYSVMKWYAPRYRGDLKSLSNDEECPFRDYGWGRYLRCMFPDGRPLSAVSNDSISVAERKIFGLIRDLYDAAIERVPLPKGACRIEVTHRNSPSNSLYFASSTVGWFVIKKINYVEGEYADTNSVLASLAPDGTIDDRKGFVLYCRKPGMIMTYDDSWGKVLSQANRAPGEFFIGIFVVNSDNTVFSDPDKYQRLCPIDQLFRVTEKSDHYGWPTDASSYGIRLINKVVSTLKSEVAKHYAAFDEVRESNPKGDISRGLGAVFASGRTGFGDRRLFPEGNGGIDEVVQPLNRETRVKAKKTQIKVGDPTFASNGEFVDVTVPILIVASEKDTSIKLEVLVETDGVPFSVANWDEADGEFPIVAKECRLEDVSLAEEVQVEVDEDTASFAFDMSKACDQAVKGRLVYTVKRTDMSTLVVRKEA